MLDNSYQTISDNSYTYLNTDCVFCGAPEPFDFKVLLQPFEEQFYKLSLFIEISYIKCRYMFGICQEGKFTIIFFIIEPDNPE